MPQNQTPAQNNLPGIFYMLGGILVLAIMDVFAKLLVEADYSPFQILAIRGWIITTVFTLAMAIRGKLGFLKTNHPYLYVARGLIGFCAPFFFFSALGVMPISDVVVIFFASPFIMTILSIPLFKEVVGWHRWAAIVVGFVGVIFVVQPSGATLQIGTVYAMIACVAYSLIQLMTRWMSTTEPALRLVFYFNLATAIIGTCALPFVWKPMSLEHLGIILAMAAVAMVGHTLMTLAFTKAPISVVAPFEYTALIWSTAFGFFIWGDFPARDIWIGAGIIVFSGIYMVHREKVKNAKEHKDNIFDGT